jgi:zinc-finger of transposase IS204/IS1001/IS1096/IS1165
MHRTWRRVEFLPSPTALRLLSVSSTDDGVVVEAAGQDSARCPACGRRSRARHSRYTRTLKDLAAQGAAVTLRLRVSRWRCRHARCETQVFTERLAEVCGRHARHARRLARANATHIIVISDGLDDGSPRPDAPGSAGAGDRGGASDMKGSACAIPSSSYQAQRHLLASTARIAVGSRPSPLSGFLRHNVYSTDNLLN